MLIDYRFNNFCSFNTAAEFSMEAAGGKVLKRFPDNYVAFDNGYDLLKAAVIVGENAGGKSNFIGSLMFLKSLFETNQPARSVRTFINSSSLITAKNPVQDFTLTILYDNGTVYTYNLKISSNGIVSEKLLKKQSRRAVDTVIFEIIRTESGEYMCAAGKAEKSVQVILKNGSSNMGLFVTKLALIGDEDAQNLTDWVINRLIAGAVATDKDSTYQNKDADLAILQDARFLDIFRMVDYSICGLNINAEMPYSKSVVVRRDSEGHEFQREIGQDSTGVREFFAWAVQIFRVVYQNKVIFADEMDRVLNPLLSDRVIAYVHGMEHTGQFVFSTHNVLHLNLKTFLKEQIYFITKSRNSLTSELYSLADFPEVRYDTTKIYEFYMKGILGGTAFE